MIYPSIGDLTRILNTWTGGFVWKFRQRKMAWCVKLWLGDRILTSGCLGWGTKWKLCCKSCFPVLRRNGVVFSGCSKVPINSWLLSCSVKHHSIPVTDSLIVMVDRTWYRHRPAELRPITMGNSPINWDLSLVNMVVYPTKSPQVTWRARHFGHCPRPTLWRCCRPWPVSPSPRTRHSEPDWDCTSLWWFYWYSIGTPCFEPTWIG